MARISSTATVHTYMDRLFESGWLETEEPSGTPRAFRIAGYVMRKEGEPMTKRELEDENKILRKILDDIHNMTTDKEIEKLRAEMGEDGKYVHARLIGRISAIAEQANMNI